MVSLNKSKKGMFFNLFLVIITLMVLTTALIRLHSKFDLPDDEKFGEKQLAIISTANYAQIALNYIDQSSKLVARQTVYDLSQSVGHIRESPCGEYMGHQVILEENKNCKPNVNQNTINKFNSNLNIQLGRFPYSSNLPSYSNSISNTEKLTIVGKTDDMFSLSIIPFESQRQKTQEQIKEVSISTAVCGIDESRLVRPESVVCQNNACRVDPLVKDKLIEAANIARNYGYEIQVTDSYRSFEDQKYLWEHGTTQHPEWAYNRSKIAEPSCDAPHTTSKVVDVILIDSGLIKKEVVDLSTMSSSVGSISEVKNIPARALLEKIMCDAGFVRFGNEANIQGEFWHYEYATDRWRRAQEKGVCAII